MKKLAISLMAATLFAMPSQAKTIDWGVKGGYNLLNISSGLNTSNKQGFFVGPMAKASIPLIGLGVDVAALYNNYEISAEGSNATKHELDLQLNVRENIGLGSTLSLFVFAGPQWGFNLGKSDYNEFKWKDSNLNINIGAGVTALSHIEFKVNYSIACGKTGDFSEINQSKLDNFKANMWQISLGYYF